MKKLLFLISFLFLFNAMCKSQSIPVSVMLKDTFNTNIPFWLNQTDPKSIEKSLYTPAPTIKQIDSTYLARYSYHWLLYYDFYTTLTAIHNLNSLNSTDVNNLYFYYNIDIKNKLTFRKVNWDLYLFSDYGVRHFFDSITIKSQDQLTFKNSFYYPIYKKLNASFSANTQTKLWNSHNYRMNANGEQERYLQDGFMSPGVIVYTGGITYQARGNATINLGLGSSKVTKIKNQHIFDTRDETKISGLEKGQKKKSEFGGTLTITVPMQTLNKHFYWEFFGNTFVPLNHLKQIKYYTIDINNVVHLLLLKYVRLSWRTKLNFNFDQNPKPVIQNQISLGFYLSNHL